MSVTQLNPSGPNPLDAVIGENVHTLMKRARVTLRDVAPLLGCSHTTLGAKVNGGTWKFTEVVAVCEYFGVTIDEITTALPPLLEWQRRWDDLRGCRDSNPRPSDP